MLTYENRNSWIARDLLQMRMWVDINDYGALHACLENGAADVAKLLLDGGMDLDQYKEWAMRQSHGLRCDETLASLEEHWAELQAQTQESAEQEQTQEGAGPEIGGIDLG